MSPSIYIYINSSADLDAYPADLLGDMSVFKDARTIQHEVQWIFYLMLKDQDMDVQIAHDVPEEGIFLIHKANAKRFVWKPNLFVVSLQWDYNRDDRAQLHLVSNRYKTSKASMGLLDRLSFTGIQYYVPPIMHPVIIPRDPARGQRFETIAFIGDPKNLDEQFRTGAFEHQLQELGMKFIIRSEPDKMSDYSDIDAVIAVRKIGKVISNKPPTKLINAWRGGVPAVLGCEVGLREARMNDADYIEVDSVAETVEALQRLKNDIKFREEMIANARQRAVPFSAEGQQATWVAFFKDEIIPQCLKWQSKSPGSKLIFLSVRWIRHLLRTLMSFVWHRILGRGASHYR